MTFSEIVPLINQHAFNSPIPPARGSSPFQNIALNINKAQQEWAAEPTIQWRSLRRQTSIGKVDSKVIYSLEEIVVDGRTIDIRDISRSLYDNVVIRHINGTDTTTLKIVEADYLNSLNYNVRGQFCTFLERDLQIGTAFNEKNAEWDGDILITHYIKPLQVDANTPDDYVIEVDDPMYVVFSAAADLIEPQFIKSGRAIPAVNRAARIMEDMKLQNEAVAKKMRYRSRPAGRTDRYSG